MITVRNISKSFGPQQVLNNVSLEIEPGKTIAVVGPSGVGKSVLLKLIMGILFQSAALFDSLSVYENIAFPLCERLKLGRREIHRRVTYMLESLSLEKFALKYPQEIPLGVRKRVGMARSLVTEPAVLLFDEPNTGLDPLVGQEVYDLINECKAKWGFTGVVISHEIPEVFQVSDRVAMLLNGEVAEEGTPKELMTSQNPAVLQFLSGSVHGPIRIQ